jgi:hypothetical protein
MFAGASALEISEGLQQTSGPELKETAINCLHRVRFCYRSQCMSVFSSPVSRHSTTPVRSIGANAWLITGSAERADTRARHGRARWSLSAGLRRKSTTTRPIRTTLA